MTVRRQMKLVDWAWHVDICHETVRYWWHRFGLVFATEIQERGVAGMRSSHWR